MVLGDFDPDGRGFDHWHHGGPPWLPLAIWAMSVVGPIAFGLVAWAFVSLFGREAPPATLPKPAPQRTAMELLRERFVLGDIDAHTFEDHVYRLLEAERWEREQAFLRALPPHLRPTQVQPPSPATVRLLPPAEPIPGTSAVASAPTSAPTMPA
jgi:hypothetical protein